MAKVKSPLLSFGASGQIGKSLVFMTWKGIADVRQYVIPANPRSAGQIAQRSLMTDAVALWHSTTRNLADIAAFGVAAAIEMKPMSGFNSFCKRVVNAYIADLAPIIPYTFTTPVNAAGTIGISVFIAGNNASFYHIGTKPNVMGPAVALTHAAEADPYTASITGCVVGTDYYLVFTTAVSGVVVVGGIYKVKALA